MTNSGASPGARRTLKDQKVSVTGELPNAVNAGEPSAKAVSERFLLRELLGQGGMGSVFVAHDRGLGRAVALKLLRDELESDRGALRRFILEAQIGAQLEHPNIVPLYSFERTDAGAPAIAMQLLEGQTMNAYIEAALQAPPAEREVRGEYALKERLGKLLAVCDAVHFAHERGVIHRDLKPDNVMLGQHREVYVMDWGLARVIGSAEPSGATRHVSVRTSASEAAPALSEEELASFGSQQTIVLQEGAAESIGGALATQQGQVMGTPQYMPPEQALGRIEHVGPAADQYAIGVMLLELSTLRPARSHTNLMQALSQAVQGHLAKPIDLDDRPIHPALAAIVARATHISIHSRYPSVRELADDVRRFVRDEPVSVYPEGMARQIVRSAARRPALATGFVAGFILLGAAIVIFVLARSAGQARRQAHDMEGSRRVIVAVSRRAQSIDVKLSDLAAEVQAIAGAAVETLELDGGAAELKPPPVFKPSAAYGGALESFEQAIADWPGIGSGEPITLNASKLLGLERWLRRALFFGLPEAERARSEAARKAALFDGKGALLRCFVGLEDGSFVQYPARVIERNHDARLRPWYRDARRDSSLRWSHPVIDAAGKTLRMQATVGLLGASDQFLGAAGCDLRIASLARELELTLPGFRRAYLVTEDGKIAVSAGLEAALVARAKDVNAELELPKVDEPLLAARIAAGEQGGYVLGAGSKLVVFSRLISPPWIYVAELDSGPYLSPE